MGAHGGGAHRLSSRRYIFGPHAVQRLRERLEGDASKFIHLSDLELETMLDQSLARTMDSAQKRAARFRDAQGDGLAVDISDAVQHPMAAILRTDRAGKLRVVASIINRDLFDLLSFWLQERRPDRTIQAPEFMEPRLIQWKEEGKIHTEEVPAFQAERKYASLVVKGIPVTSIAVWRPVRITVDLKMIG